MLGPGVVEVSVDLEGLTVGNVELPAPPRKTLATGVGVEALGGGTCSLGNEPVDRQVDNLVAVTLSEATGLREPLGVDSLLCVVAHTHVELDTCKGAVGVPPDFNAGVPVLLDELVEAFGW